MSGWIVRVVLGLSCAGAPAGVSAWTGAPARWYPGELSSPPQAERRADEPSLRRMPPHAGGGVPPGADVAGGRVPDPSLLGNMREALSGGAGSASGAGFETPLVVPLPPSAFVLAGALGLLGAVARPRRKRRPPDDLPDRSA